MYFGGAMSAADVNNDGFADLLIGDYGYGFSGYGRVYVYFGGPFGDTIPDLVYSGETSQEYHGSVSTAGDLNRDGIEDMIIGARGVGKVYIHLSTPPVISTVIYYQKDVPFDQGGRVLLNWRKSANDVTNGSVTSYSIERSAPPGISGFSWEPVGTTDASGNSSYSFTASTLNDSMSGNSGTKLFRIHRISKFYDLHRAGKCKPDEFFVKHSAQISMHE